MVALETLQDFAGQSVKLNQCPIQLFDLRKNYQNAATAQLLVAWTLCLKWKEEDHIRLRCVVYTFSRYSLMAVWLLFSCNTLNYT